MKKRLLGITAAIMMFFSFSMSIFAQSDTYVVKSGDSMWKIAVKYQIGLSEITAANPQIKNPALIYPGDKIYIPNIDDVKKLENDVIVLVNKERAKQGLPALKTNWELCRVARYKSQDMIDRNYFAHQSPTYGSPFDMMKNFGMKFTSAGENIARGQRTPQEVMNSWMNSPGHKSNILSSSYSEIGVGVAKDKNGNLTWTQMFMRPY